MKKLLLLILIVSCNTKSDLQTRAKNYMKDSVVTGFDEPGSYEFVSIKTDTINRAKYDTALVEANIEESIKEIGKSVNHYNEIDHLYDSLRTEIRKNKKDSNEICQYIFNIDFRSKNLMGALALNHYQIVLNTADNKMKVK